MITTIIGTALIIMMDMVDDIPIAIARCLPIWYMTQLTADTDKRHVGLIYILITLEIERMPQ